MRKSPVAIQLTLDNSVSLPRIPNIQWKVNNNTPRHFPGNKNMTPLISSFVDT